ncbi:hypothetical protein L6164_014057 [Bauhinia variegata]|uniref:Uncharacterized protein n=1 Tax=Bauhinia variegata TaxID=167791 RepID=A0ACB9NG18_BAUVA|nr:hypothetical protein L6164_014057 [Bauhinia variegata]
MDSHSCSSTSPSAHSHSQNQNWLAFTLSPHPSHSPLSLFHSFSSSSPAPPLTLTGSNVDASPEAADASVGGATNLSIFTAGPKFEDFLGGSSTATTTTTTTTASTAPPPLPHFSTDNEIYDSELKTIAASFLRGFAAAEQTEPQKQQLLAPSEPSPRKSVDTFGQRTSIYRGVTRHRWTGRYEAHLWDNSCRREGQSRKGRQGLNRVHEDLGLNHFPRTVHYCDRDRWELKNVLGSKSPLYLGGYDKEEKAARAYDLAALKYWGPTTTTNFPISNYEKELEEMKNMTRQEFVASLRRKSSGFSRGASIYRGVTRHHQHGRWQARIGRVAGNKDLYLGTFSTQEEAAEAYDIAAIKFRGLNAVTNFDMSRYDVKSIANSNLPIGGLSSKAKNSTDSHSETKSHEGSRSDDRDPSSASASSSLPFASYSQPSSSTLSFAIPIKQDPSDYWSILGYQNHSLTAAKSSFQSTSNGSSLQSSNATPFNADFSAAAASNSSTTTTGSEGNNNNAFFNGGIFMQQQNASGATASASSSIPFATPITLNSNSSYESSFGFGNWIGPTLHTFQTHAKPSLFQTPIFGME